MNIIELFQIKPRLLKYYIKLINKLAEVKYNELDTITKKILFIEDIDGSGKKIENNFFWDTITDKYSTTNNIKEIQEFVSEVYDIYKRCPNNKYSEDLIPLDENTGLPIKKYIYINEINGFCYDRVTYFKKIIENINESSTSSVIIGEALNNVIATVDGLPLKEKKKELERIAKKAEKIANVSPWKKGLLFLGMLAMIGVGGYTYREEIGTGISNNIDNLTNKYQAYAADRTFQNYTGFENIKGEAYTPSPETLRKINIYQPLNVVMSKFTPSQVINAMIEDAGHGVTRFVYPEHYGSKNKYFDIYNRIIDKYFNKHKDDIIKENPELDTLNNFKINAYWLKIHGKNIKDVSMYDFSNMDTSHLYSNLYVNNSEDTEYNDALKYEDKYNTRIRNLDIELYYKFDNNAYRIKTEEPLIQSLDDFKMYITWHDRKMENGNFIHFKSISKTNVDDLKSLDDIVDFYDFHKVKTISYTINLGDFIHKVKINNMKRIIDYYITITGKKELDILAQNIEPFQPTRSEFNEIRNYIIDNYGPEKQNFIDQLSDIINYDNLLDV